MAGYEQTIIIGNVGRDPELKYLPSGSAVCNFSVAVTTRWNDRQSGEKREKTNWVNVSAFNKSAEILAQYVKKGSQIMIEGTVSARAYMGQDGEPRASLDLRVNNFQFLGGRGDNAGGGGGNYDNSDSNYDNNQGGNPQELDDIPF